MVNDSTPQPSTKAARNENDFCLTEKERKKAMYALMSSKQIPSHQWTHCCQNVETNQ